MTRAPAFARPYSNGIRCRGVSPLEALSDLDALERLLARSMRSRAPDAAADLLHRFGSLEAVLTADPVLLQGLVGPRAAEDLRLAHDIACRLAAMRIAGREVISSWSALNAYLKLTMAPLTREAFRVLFLDKKNRLIADEVMAIGTVDHAPLYPREVMRRALELAASAIILVHNHPSGDPTPSSADIDMTRQVVEAGRALRIVVHDHVVVAQDGVASFKALGLI